jgi:hypothetical protein
MKNVISYSLWGNHPKYWNGALRNIELAKKIYPSWISKFYIDRNCDPKLIETLNDPDVEIQLVDNDFLGTTYNGTYEHSHQGMFWRFLVYEDSNVDYFISRDCDSRLSLREYDAVMEWIESGKRFHIMRDHPYHRAPILGGMWGSKCDLLKEIDLKSKIIEWNKIKMNYSLGVDQDFLGRVIYPLVFKESIEHSEFGIMYSNSVRNFSTNRINFEFVGDSFDENDVRHPEYWKFIK